MVRFVGVDDEVFVNADLVTSVTVNDDGLTVVCSGASSVYTPMLIGDVVDLLDPEGVPS